MILTHVSLFAGIGGIDIAAEWAGFETVAQVEIDNYCTEVLEKHWPNVLRWRDIRNVTGEEIRSKTGIAHPTLVSGGFPCPPFSEAGKRRGREDDRYLWPEMFRVVRELHPRWVMAENVYGLVTYVGGLELRQVYVDLEIEGYETLPSVILPAAGVNAPHRRYRVFIVAHRNQQGLQGRISRELQECSSQLATGEGNTFLADTRRAVPQECQSSGECGNTGRGAPERIAGGGGFRRREGLEGWPIDGAEQWSVEPDVGRVAHGVPHRVDRLRALGNAVVPQQVYPILAAIAQLEVAT